jgi:hypothetical protein
MNKIYAKIENSTVVDVIVAEPKFIEMLTTMEIDGKTDHNWIDTTDCKNDPAVGSTYRSDLNAFVHPRPYANAVWDETVFDWIPPVAKPDGNNWFWDQAHNNWISESDPS